MTSEPTGPAVVLTAVATEARIVTRQLEAESVERTPFWHSAGRIDRREVVVVRMGVGPARAMRATAWAIDTFAPSHLLVCGFAGGLDPTLRMGTVLQPHEVHRQGKPPIPLANLGPTSGATTILSRDELAETPSEKEDLFRRSGCQAVDMETYEVASVAAEHQITPYVIRAISDDAHTSLDRRFMRLVDSSGDVRPGKVVTLLLSNPTSVMGLMRLGRDATIASDALWASLRHTLERLSRRPRAP
ncbi:5'-methylthioadenosine/S-adenosylhomocysteine nucleosidase [Planctomycetes bacterium Pan216]|uniref:5'-methylthioadenosine/S-adenosylhomocysteine nucleosidase n=1 Tax=Kolteria novifilia TaxID=2527975 RepID=A0A518BCM4_9BACT|nr:5'-methylthioadenosine/S-adenosylhomocysteine nucleosidase [Planctomycetes bacterium Pan216]